MKTRSSSQDTGISPAALSALALGDLENFLVASAPGGIEAQEKRGQLEQAEKETLPIDLGQRYGKTEIELRAPWEKLGFRFGPAIDKLFCSVKFPTGWKKQPTEHSMWTSIVDEKGRKRGMIFFKAAFYDMSAHAHLERRFGVDRDWDSDPVSLSIADACGEVKKRIDGLAKPNWSEDRNAATIADEKIRVARKELEDWLTANYPKWDDPTEYWT